MKVFLIWRLGKWCLLTFVHWKYYQLTTKTLSLNTQYTVAAPYLCTNQRSLLKICYLLTPSTRVCGKKIRFWGCFKKIRISSLLKQKQTKKPALKNIYYCNVLIAPPAGENAHLKITVCISTGGDRHYTGKIYYFFLHYIYFLKTRMSLFFSTSALKWKNRPDFYVKGSTSLKFYVN